MKQLVLIIALTLVSAGTWGDFSCPHGTESACLENGDTVCPDTAKCVDVDVVCFDKQTCAPDDGFICESRYDDVMSDYEEAVGRYNELTTENVDLRERRLAQKNCVINAPTLEDARKCVRKP